MSWLLRLWGRFRYVIGDGPNGPLLIRYRLISTRWGGVYLHHLMRSDLDRDLHDHPWAFWSLIIWRGYYEQEPLAGQWAASMPTDPPGMGIPPVTEAWERRRVTWRAPLTVVRHEASDRHALDLDRPAWSLIWVGPRTHEWGFHTEQGWVAWQEYSG